MEIEPERILRSPFTDGSDGALIISGTGLT